MNTSNKMKMETTYKIALALLACALPIALYAAAPKVGDKAPDFSLETLDDQTLRLSDLTATGKMVLVVLRGWPGYQCPLCTRQVQDYIASASGFATAKARVVMVYPGPADDLKAHATEFSQNKQWPKEFVFVTDPAFTMVNAYGLRWDAPGETAYPSTFVLDRKGVVRFATISHGHGDRTKAADIIEELQRMGSD
jgi:peroxiredoxin